MILGSAETVGGGDIVWAIVVTVLACVPLGISVWALLDAARRPRWVWALSTHPQTPWMAAVAAGVLLTVVGLAISLWYLLKVRPDLAAIERGDLGGTVGR
ncbi:MAG TPA: hypothetical protein VF228_26290 [Iamia sp.]